MSRFILIILLASMLTACGSSPDAPLTAGDSAANQQTTISTQAPALPSSVPATTVASATDRPLSPTATYVPTPTTAPAVPTAQSTTTAAPTVTIAPTTPSQPITKTIIAERSTITGTVTINAQRPIPPNAVLRVQLGRENRDGIAYFSVIDQQESPIQDAKPVSFALTYRASDLEPVPGSQIPDAYYVVAELLAPGRMPWNARSEPLDLSHKDAPVAVTLAPPANIAEVNGTLTIPDQPALPADATLTVRLVGEQGYRPDDPTRTDLVIPSVKPGKLPFTIEYITTSEPQQVYAAHAEVRAGAKLPLISQLVPAVKQGQPSTVDLVLAPPTSIASVTGTVTYTPQQPIPADARLTLEISDASVSDGPSYVIASHTVTPVGASPVSFAIEYDPALTDQSRMYSVHARIMVGEKLLFINDIYYGVITDGNDKPVEMALRTLD
jgi:putative lipoprotein